ncbi:MAG: hypothetical protein EA360_02485 [Balneolaceae bacterium]|nr:MAG: hypothetical protein EA360_02485 [Balneolaceae bacterium]
MHFVKSFRLLLLSILFLILLFPAASTAQMFSIDNPEPRREQTLGTKSMAGLSWEPASFSFWGDPADNNELLDFNNSILRFRLDSPSLVISLGFGGNITGMDGTSFLGVNARLLNNLGIIRRPDFQFGIPIQLTSDLTRVRLDDTDTEFQQSSLIFGSGLFSNVKLSDRFSLNIAATPNYGFSFSQGNFFGGSLFRFDGKTLLFIHNLFGESDLTLGYHFDYRRYDIDGNIYDYDFTSHSITLGIAF